MNKAQFKNEVIGNIKYVRRWLRDLAKLNKITEKDAAIKEYKLKQMRIIANSWYCAYLDLVNLLDKYQK